MPSSRRSLPKFYRSFLILCRRGLNWFDRHAPAWGQNATPWSASFLVHGIIVLVLALIAFFLPKSDEPNSAFDAFSAELDNQLLDDITTLERDETPGDPFTKLFEETASLPLDPSEIDPEVVQLPDLITQFAPTLEAAELELPGNPRGSIISGISEAPSRLRGDYRQSPFSGRSAASRAALLRREGGTAESEEAVERGLEWLARHQAPAGYWSLDIRNHCTEGPCPGSASKSSDTAATGLALLPMLGAGHTHLEPGRYRASVERGLRWLVSVQQPSGELFLGGSENTRMYSHAIAAMAICEAYAMTQDPNLRGPAQGAIDFIVMAQNQVDGGWRYAPGMRGDTSVFGWQLFCLRSASLAGLTVPNNVVIGCSNYLDAAAADPLGATYSYTPGGRPRPVMTAEALLCRQYLGWRKSSRSLRAGAGEVYKHLMTSGERNIYYWYYATQLLHNLGGETWKRWNRRIREELIQTQMTGDDCDRGSWSPVIPEVDRWGQSAGRLYTTSLSLLTLEVYYRYLPLYENLDRDPLLEPSAEEESDLGELGGE